MTPREERGLVIAATQKLTQKGKVWLVPSQSGKGKYTVHPDPETPFCSCPDHEETGGRCKHIHAVEIAMKRETAADGTVTEIRTLTFSQKKVYKRDWPTYTLSQVEEKRRLQAMLFDLCRGVENPPENRCGRKRTAMADMIFTSVLKVYTTLSSRRFGTDLEEATAKGYLSHKMHPCMVCTFLESGLLTPVLKELIAVSAAPLRVVETDFAVDSTGFSTGRFVRWTDEKYGGQRSGRDWVKCHAITGVKTHVVTAVEILDRDAADAPLFKPLVSKTAENFRVEEVSGDKGYLSAENIEAVFKHGGTPFIAFKANTTGAAGGLFEQMFHYYSLHREQYLAHYHKRSNVESTFSAIKRKFGDFIRSKTDHATRNEVLCKLLAHNLCCLILSQLELGIAPEFWPDASAEQDQPFAQLDPAPVGEPTEHPAPIAIPIAARRQAFFGA